jgi:hypothetical protein
MPMGGLSLEVIRLRFLRIAPWWGSSLEEGFGQKSILAVSRSLVPSYMELRLLQVTMGTQMIWVAMVTPYHRWCQYFLFAREGVFSWFECAVRRYI